MAGLPDGEWHGQRDGDVRSQHGQPAVVGARLVHRPADDRQPGHEVVPQAVEVVVGPELLDAAHRQVCPRGELVGHQARRQRHRGVDLVRVQPGHGWPR